MQKRRDQFSAKNLELLYDYNDDMIISSISENTRYKNLTVYGKLTNLVRKDWIDVTEKDLRNLVSQIMVMHGENGKETGYTFDLKIQLKSIVRFAKTAFRKQILKFHSDKNQIDDADEYVKLLYMIRETLLSSEKRFAYDAMRHGGTV